MQIRVTHCKSHEMCMSDNKQDTATPGVGVAVSGMR